MERFRKEGVESDSAWVEYCLGCHRCGLACPHGVDVSELIAKAKATHKKTGVRALRDHWFARPDLLGRVGSSIAPVSNAVAGFEPARWLMSSLAQVASQRHLPKYSSRPLRANPISNAFNREVVFFPGCFIRYNNPELGRTVVDLLRLNGFSVEVAGAACCGMPALANGDAGELAVCIEKNVADLSPAVDRGACIVTACTSCGYALKADYAHRMADTPLAVSAQAISSHTYDLAEFLCNLMDEGMLNTDFEAVHRRLAYHAPCHLKSQGIGRPWLRLLRAIPGMEIEEIKADCCGMSGTYGFKKEKYSISMNIGKELFDGIAAYNPEMAVTECGSCQMQIEHGTGLKALHPAEILYAAYQGAAKAMKETPAFC
jgi:glycerol-3-phosphate dehydrogenase subunit C